MRYTLELGLDAGPYAAGGARVDATNRRMAGSATALEGTMRGLKSLVASIGLSFLASQAGQVATAFDDSLTRVNTLVGVAKSQVGEWRDELLRLGPEIGKGPRELADTLYFVTSSGESGAAALGIVESAARAAAVGLGRTEDVARLVTAAMQAYKSEGLTAAAATDILVAAVREGSAEADAMASSLGTTIAFAQSVGVSFAQAAAFVATYTKLGVSAEIATTGLNSALRALVTDTPEQTKALRSVNMTLSDLRKSIAEKGLAQGLLDLRAILDKTLGKEAALTALKDIIPDIQGFQAVLAVTGGLAEDYLGVQERVIASTGDLAKAEQGAAQSVGYTMRQLKAEGEVLQIVFGDQVAGAVAEAVRNLGGFDGAARSAAELGRLAGEAIGVLVRALDFLADHSHITVAAVEAFVALRLLSWIRDVTVAFGLYSAAVGSAGTVNATTSGIVAKTIPIYGAQGQVLRQVAVGAGTARVALLSLASVATALVISGIALNEFTKALGDSFVRESAEIVAAAKRAQDALGDIRKRAADAIATGSSEQMLAVRARLNAELETAIATEKRLADQLRTSRAVHAANAAAGYDDAEAAQAVENAHNEAAAKVNVLRAEIDGLTDASQTYVPTAEAVAAATATGGNAAETAAEKLRALKLSMKQRIDILKKQVELSKDARDADLKLAASGAQITQAIRDQVSDRDVYNAIIERGLATQLDPSTGLPKVSEEIFNQVRHVLEAAKAQEELNEFLKETKQVRRDVATADQDEKVEIDGLLINLTEELRLRKELIDRIEDHTDTLLDGYDFSKDAIESGNREFADYIQSWEYFGNVAADALSSVDEGLADLVGGLADAVGAWQRYAQAVREARSAEEIRAAQAQAGAATAGAVQSVSNYFGLAGGGTSQFGGRQEGNLMNEGAEIGGYFGGYGAIIGAVIGAFIQTGADDMAVVLEQRVDGAGATIQRAEGGLVDLANDMVDLIDGFLGDVETMTGSAVDEAATGLSIHARGDLVTVMVNGLVQGFRDMDEAVAWGLQQVLSRQDFKGQAGEAVTAALRALGGPESVGSVEQLANILGMAQAIDDMNAGAGPYLQQLREILHLRQGEMEIAREFNISLADTIRLTDRRLAQEREAVEANLRAIAGGSDYLTQVLNATQIARDYNTGISEEMRIRQERIAQLQAEIPALQAAADAWTGAGSAAADAAQQVSAAAEKASADANAAGRGAREGLGRGPGGGQGGSVGLTDNDDDISIVAGRHADRLGEVLDARNAVENLERAREELDALTASLGELPQAIDQQAITDAWTAAGSQAVVAMIDLLQQARGEAFLAGEEQRALGELYQLKVAAEYAGLLNLIAASEGLFAVSQATLDAIGAAVGQVLAMDPATLGRRTRGGSGAGQLRRDAVEQLRREAADVAASLAGVTDAEIQYRHSIEDLKKQYAEARLGAAEAARAARDLAAVFLRDLAEPFREATLQAGETDLETQMRQLAEQMQDALSAAMAAAAEDPDGYKDAAEAIRQGFADQVAALIQDTLVGLGDAALGLELQTRETVGTIGYLLAHLEELGITAEQVANSVRQGVLPDLLELAAQQAERAGLDEEAAEIRAQRAKLELALQRLQFESMVAILEAAGAISDELRAQIDHWRELFDLPTAEGGGGEGAGAQGPTIEDLRQQLADLAQEGLSPSLQGLRDWMASTEDLREYLLSLKGSTQEAVDGLALLDAQLRAQQLAAARGFLDEVEAFLGVPLPVEQTQALALAMFELQRAQLLVALASAEMIAALTLAGVDIQALIESITNAEYTPPELPQVGGRGGRPDAIQQTIDELARAREALADFVRGLKGDVMDPVARSIYDLQERFRDVKDALLAAGGRAAELAEAEMLVAERREQILREAAEPLLELKRKLTFGELSLANPFESIQDSVAHLLGVADQIRGGELSKTGEFASGVEDLLDYVEQTYGVNSRLYDDLRVLFQQQEAALEDSFGAGVGGEGVDVGDDPTTILAKAQLTSMDRQLAAVQAADEARSREATAASYERQMMLAELRRIGQAPRDQNAGSRT